MKARNLKIEASGDFWRGKVTPKIRLTGQWLERAGFEAGNRVEIELIQSGTLTLRFLPANDNNSPQLNSALSRLQDDLL